MYCQSTLNLSGEVTFCVLCCHVFPNVLVKYLQPAWGDTPVLLPDASQCTVRVPSICLGELHLPSVPVGPDFVCQILCRNLLVLEWAQLVLRLSWGTVIVWLYFLLLSASNILSKYLSAAWGSHSLFLLPSVSCCTVKYLWSVCGVTSVTVSKYLLGSCLWFLSRSYFCLSNLLVLLLVFFLTSIFIQDCISSEDL